MHFFIVATARSLDFNTSDGLVKSIICSFAQTLKDARDLCLCRKKQFDRCSLLHSRFFFTCAIAALIAVSFLQGTGRKYLSIDNPDVDVVQLQKGEVDYHMLYPAIKSKQTFMDTFRWWIEPWRADQNVGAYWRPLSMQMWWGQSHVFGESKFFNWMRISLLLSVCFDLLLFAFLKAFTKNFHVALLGLAFFLLPPAWLSSLTPLAANQTSGTDLLLAAGWLDQPDLWANCLTLVALLCVLRERWVWAILASGLAIAFKESGLMIFPLALVVIGCTHGIRRIPLWVFISSLCMLGAMMYARWLAGPLVFHFHSYGNNVSGPTRLWNAISPLAFAAFSSPAQWVFALGACMTVLFRPKKLIVWFATLCGLALLCVFIESVQQKMPLDIAFAHLIDSGSLPIALLVMWILLFVVLFKERMSFRTSMVFAACALIGALPLGLATQAGEHCLALGRGFEAGFGACWTYAIVRQCIVAARRIYVERVAVLIPQSAAG